MTNIKALGRVIERNGNNRYEAHEIIEQKFDLAPKNAQVATVSVSLEIGQHRSGEAGLWSMTEFIQRFLPNPK